MKTTENCYSPSNDKFNQSDPAQSIVALFSHFIFYTVPSYLDLDKLACHDTRNIV